HEQRIDRALDMHPELMGSIGYKDLDLERYYDDIVHYVGGTPGTITVDGIFYALYVGSDVSGCPLHGIHAGASLVGKLHHSFTCGHSHVLDWSVQTRADGSKLMGLHAGVYQDYVSEWAGESQKFWTPGVAIKRNVENGCYDLEWVSMDRLRKEYG